MNTILLYVTTKDLAEAKAIAQALVEKELVACANFWEGMHSIYRWEGKIESAQETVLLLKTRAELQDAVVDAVRELHSYSCPCVVALPIQGGNPDYLRWIVEST